jgi:hypothetical protein
MERVGSVRAAVVWTVGAVAAVACLNLVVGVAQAAAQTPPPAQAPAPPAQAPDPLLFTANAPVLMVFQIKTDKTADFESAWGAIRAAFGKAAKPETKAFGETLQKLYKVEAGGAAPQPVSVYLLQIDAPSKTYSYDLGKVIYMTLMEEKALTREEADAIIAKLKDSLAGINPWVLTKVG